MSKNYQNESSFSSESRYSRSKEHRKSRRHPVHWRVAIVRKIGDKSDIYHGRTHDISLSGSSVYADRNIFAEEPVVMLLALPPQHTGLKEYLIEIRCRMLYTVISEDGRFRIGIQFLDFKDDGRKVLEDHLSQRVIPEEKKNYRIE